MPDLDDMTDEQAIFTLERQFPGWLVYRGAERLCHGRHHIAETHVRGEDWTGLRDMITREIAQAPSFR